MFNNVYVETMLYKTCLYKTEKECIVLFRIFVELKLKSFYEDKI